MAIYFRLRQFVLIGLLVLTMAACTEIGTDSLPEIKTGLEEVQENVVNVLNSTEEAGVKVEEGSERPTGWSADTHSSDAEPNYLVVFPQDEVNEIIISISPENWQMMMDDMTRLYGPQGRGDAHTAPMGDRPLAAAPPVIEGPQPQAAVERNEFPGRMEADDQNPIWVAATVEFEGMTWEYVGVRFKGNSSLRASWSNGSLKLPLKLDFDEFEDQYPAIDDQRFFGFKQLSFSSNWKDGSFLHEKVAYDVFNEAGVIASQTAFYAVYFDYGAGAEYIGLYTLVEVVDDTLIETRFDDSEGNVYKPAGRGATFARGTFNEQDFDKETNQDEADYEDILALFAALHSDSRMTDPVLWRVDLEQVFDVDTFLNWLAVNSVIQNWDTYGVMSHNYYLYTDPASGQLTWIPWDNNEAFNSNPGKRQIQTVDQSSVSEEWPLIKYLLDDAIYHEQYVDYVKAVSGDAFEPGKMTATYQYYHDLIDSYVAMELAAGDSAFGARANQVFEDSLEIMIQHVHARFAAVAAFVANQ